MSLEKYSVYEASGRTLEIMKAWQDRRDAAVAARRAFAASVAADAEAIGSLMIFCGISTAATLDPKEWSPSKAYIWNATAPCYEPNKKSKAGKAITKAMGDEKFRIPDDEELSSDFKFSFFTTPVERSSGMACHFLCGQRVGDKMILFVPSPKKYGVEGSEWIPEDAQPIKLSEYHAMIERQQEIEAAEKA